MSEQTYHIDTTTADSGGMMYDVLVSDDCFLLWCFKVEWKGAGRKVSPATFLRFDGRRDGADMARLFGRMEMPACVFADWIEENADVRHPAWRRDTARALRMLRAN
jgi:hypothetical protein